MTAVDLSAVYTTTNPPEAAVLRCTEHPDWEVDVDGTDLPTVVRYAKDHIRRDHAADGH